MILLIYSLIKLFIEQSIDLSIYHSIKERIHSPINVLSYWNIN